VRRHGEDEDIGDVAVLVYLFIHRRDATRLSQERLRRRA
jgi:hypothetical protein